jgi:hypothetical protein
MEPLLLPSERSLRAELLARGIVAFVSTAICYTLLWKWDYLGWSPGSMALAIAVPLFFSLMAMANNPVEGTVACAMMLGLIAVALSTYRNMQIKRDETIEIAKGRSVVISLFQYADGHDGYLPGKLEGATLNGIPPEALHFHDPRTRQVGNWLYYGSGNAKLPSLHRTIILASPPMLNPQKRIAVFSDGAAQILDEENFGRQLSEQLHGK